MVGHQRGFIVDKGDSGGLTYALLSADLTGEMLQFRGREAGKQTMNEHRLACRR